MTTRPPSRIQPTVRPSVRPSFPLPRSPSEHCSFYMSLKRVGNGEREREQSSEKAIPSRAAGWASKISPTYFTSNIVLL